MFQKWTYFVKLNHFTVPSLIQAIFGMLLVVPITTYYLEPKDFGQFAIINTLVVLIGVIATPATAYTINKNFNKVSLKKRERLVGTLLLFEFFVKFSFMIILCILIYIVSKHEFFKIYIDIFEPKLLLISVTTFAVSFCWPLLSLVLILNNNSNLHFRMEVFRVGCMITLPIILITIFDLGALTLYISPLIMQTFSLIFEIWIIKRFISFRIDFDIIKETLNEWQHSFIASVFENGYEFFHRILCSFILSLASLGIFIHAMSYINILKIVNKGIVRSFASELFKEFSSGKLAVPNNVHKFSLIYLLLFSALGLIVIFISAPVISLITHNKFNEAAILVATMYSMSFLIIPHSIMNYFLMATGKSKIISYSTILSRLIIALSIPPFLYKFNILGNAIIYLLVYLIPFCIMVIYTNRFGLKCNFIYKPIVALFFYLTILTIYNYL